MSPDDLARFRLPEEMQRRLQELLDRQDRGETLSPDERREAEGIVEFSEVLSLLRLRFGRFDSEAKRFAPLDRGFYQTAPRGDRPCVRRRLRRGLELGRPAGCRPRLGTLRLPSRVRSPKKTSGPPLRAGRYRDDRQPRRDAKAVSLFCCERRAVA